MVSEGGVTMKKNAMPSDILIVAIHEKCMECSGNQRKEVERCMMKECALYPYRSAKAIENSIRAREQREEIYGQVSFDFYRGGEYHAKDDVHHCRTG